VAWVDAATGRSYESGYYDEDGQHYDSVAFAQNGKYENVVCHCPYCDHESILTISATEASSQSLKCPNCGATMEIRSALDDAIDPGYDETSRSAAPGKPRRTVRNILIGIAVATLALIGLGVYGSKLIKEEEYSQTVEQYEIENDDQYYDDTDYYEEDVFGSTIGLTRTGDNSYAVSEEGGDKLLVWDADADSYYDEQSECWLWYNTDVEPAVWQYWYEGISSDFGDYGWMEHDEEGWFIEEEYGSWIPLPEDYDASQLWYIE